MKKESQIQHFLNAMQQRTDNCSIVDMISFNDLIRENKAIHIKKQSNRSTIKGLFYKDKWIAVVYDKIRKQVVTVLPECDENYTKLLKIIKNKNERNPSKMSNL